MRIGINFGAEPAAGEGLIDGIVELGKAADAKGFSSFWLPNIFSFDAIGTLTVVGRETERIRVGTAVTPTYPRHPTALAQQALTAAAATGNRFTLGIGLSHRIVIENMLGFSFERPARHMREYLSVLMPALRGEPVNFDGEHYRVHGLQLTVPGAAPVPTVVAALGPAMLSRGSPGATGCGVRARRRDQRARRCPGADQPRTLHVRPTAVLPGHARPGRGVEPRRCRGRRRRERRAAAA